MRRRAKKTNKIPNLNNLSKRFWVKTLKFTETVVVWVTILYVINWVSSVAIIIWAIKETQNFAYLDTLITETSSTFRDVVGVAIIKFGVENIFKYNDFGGKVVSNGSYEDEFSIKENEGGKG